MAIPLLDRIRKGLMTELFSAHQMVEFRDSIGIIGIAKLEKENLHAFS
jgi:hypothetical protein